MRLNPTKATRSLSAQQIVSCDTNNLGCNGGNPEGAYDYVKNFGGLETDSSYPYTSGAGSTGTCVAKFSLLAGGVNIPSSFIYLSLRTEANVQTYVNTKGPLSICLSATDWNTYKSGIKATCTTDVNHCVQLVGIDTTGPTPYWILRNQWGTGWGELGYMKLQFGSNLCVITTNPNYLDNLVAL